MPAERVMLLIDADNVSVDVMEQAVEALLAEHGGLHVRRAYCTAESALKHQATFKRLGIKPMVNLAAGKNSTDIAMAVDAIDLVMAERPDIVAIASSDSDFAPLVMRLREKGCRVVGIGQDGKTGDETISVYDAFTVFAHRKSRASANAPAARGGRAPARRDAPQRAPSARVSPAVAAAAPVAVEAAELPAASAAGGVGSAGSERPSRRRRGGRRNADAAARRDATPPSPSDAATSFAETDRWPDDDEVTAATPAGDSAALTEAAGTEEIAGAAHEALERAPDAADEAAGPVDARPARPARSRRAAPREPAAAAADPAAGQSESSGSPEAAAAPAAPAARKLAPRRRKTADAAGESVSAPAGDTGGATAASTDAAARPAAEVVPPASAAGGSEPAAERAAPAPSSADADMPQPSAVQSAVAVPAGRARQAAAASASAAPAPGASASADPGARPARKQARARTPAAVAAPAPAAPAAPPAAAWPDEIRRILAALPELLRGETLELRVATERLRDAELLGPRASSTRFFAPFAERFELLPAGQPNKVRLRPVQA